MIDTFTTAAATADNWRRRNQRACESRSDRSHSYSIDAIFAANYRRRRSSYDCIIRTSSSHTRLSGSETGELFLKVAPASSQEEEEAEEDDELGNGSRRRNRQRA